MVDSGGVRVMLLVLDLREDCALEVWPMLPRGAL
jgi:hypothetical protein